MLAYYVSPVIDCFSIEDTTSQFTDGRWYPLACWENGADGILRPHNRLTPVLLAALEAHFEKKSVELARDLRQAATPEEKQVCEGKIQHLTGICDRLSAVRDLALSAFSASERILLQESRKQPKPVASVWIDSPWGGKLPWSDLSVRPQARTHPAWKAVPTLPDRIPPTIGEHIVVEDEQRFRNWLTSSLQAGPSTDGSPAILIHMLGEQP